MPTEGQPASCYILFHSIDLSLSGLTSSFQPASLLPPHLGMVRSALTLKQLTNCEHSCSRTELCIKQLGSIELRTLLGIQSLQLLNPLTTNDDYSCHQNSATCYQLVQSVLKIGYSRKGGTRGGGWVHHYG